jgi:MGT family glycosyltransferase
MTQPKRFLFAVWDGGGCVPPLLSMAGALVTRGHDVRILADPVLEPEVAAVGADFRPWRSAPHRVTRGVSSSEVVRDWEAKTPFGGFALIRDRLICGPAADFARDVLGELDRHPADVVVPDCLLLGVAVAAEARDIPVAFSVSNVLPLPRPGVPPFGAGLKPARGPLGRARDSALGFATARLWARGLPALNAARIGLGLAALQSPFDQFARAERLLVLTSAAFDYPSFPIPANARYVGPRLDDPSWADESTALWPSDDARPLVLVGLSSTYQDQLPVVQRIATALGRLPVRGLITVGPAVSADAIAAPENVAVVASAPHGAVLPKASAVITHAGHGTVIKALAAGVPLVCLPMGRDQDDTAARAVLTGCGVRLKPSASVRAIAAATETVLADTRYRAAAEAMATVIADDVRSDRAVDELEALAQRARPTSSPRTPSGAGLG